MSTIQVKKIGMGFLNASQRASCMSCADSIREPHLDTPKSIAWWCTQGGFMVSSMAVCNKHKPRAQSRPNKSA